MKTDQPLLHQEADDAETTGGGHESAGRTESRGLIGLKGDASDFTGTDVMRRLFHPSDEAILEIYMGGGYY